MPSKPSIFRIRLSLPFILLCVLFSVLWIAGGASRMDALGQVVVRSVSGVLLVIAILFGRAPQLRPARPVALFLLAAVVLPLAQLIPMPPVIWQALPGHRMLEEAGAASGQAGLWRPWSIVPGATANAALSLLIPLATLTLAAGLERAEHIRLAAVILLTALASSLIGIIQFSGAIFDNPMVNDVVGEVSGMFANRNHFALLLAIGCLLAPVWAFQGGRVAPWRALAAIGLVFLFVLSILASGSRVGMALGLLAILIGLALVRRGVAQTLRGLPSWATWAALGGTLAALAVIVLISVAAERAVAVDRALAIDPGQDMRRRGLPTVIGMIREYFPWGSGLGGFDPIFRMHEPLALLEPTYFNRAHNDLIEVVLDAGLPGLLLLLSFFVWWAWASFRAWRAADGKHDRVRRLGSATLLLIMIASAVDYPARTPIVMAIIVIAGLWLAGAADEPRRLGLPRSTSIYSPPAPDISGFSASICATSVLQSGSPSP